MTYHVSNLDDGEALIVVSPAAEDKDIFALCGL